MSKVKKALSLMLVILILSTIGSFLVYGIDAPPVTVTIGDSYGFSGDEVTVPINFGSVPSVGINNCDFRLEYDINALELVSISAGNIVKRPDINFRYGNYISNGKGIIGFLYIDETECSPIISDGNFANIKFRIKNTPCLNMYRINKYSVGAFAIPNTYEKLQTVFEHGVVIALPY